MDIFYQGIYSFLCVVGFSIIFNLPKRLIFLASINGMLGWIVFAVLQEKTLAFIFPPLIGSLFVGIFGEFSAIYKKQPATIFIIPAIIPFVPGYEVYNTMLFVIENDFANATISGFKSLFISISIACGIVIATSLVRHIRILFNIPR